VYKVCSSWNNKEVIKSTCTVQNSGGRCFFTTDLDGLGLQRDN